MSYNIIQKNFLYTNISFQYSPIKTVFISQCLFNYLDELYKQIDLIEEEDPKTLQLISHIINPYQYLLTNVPDSDFSVSKVKPQSNVFFELSELFQLAQINEYSIHSCKYIDCGLFTYNNISIEYYLNVYREDCNDKIVLFDINEREKYYNIIKNKSFNTKLFDLLFFEIDFQNKLSIIILHFLINILLIIKYQKKNGTSIFKMSYLFYKPIIDCVYILSCIFEKIQFIKPSTSNTLNPDFYLVCKGFNETTLLSNLEVEIEKYYELLNSKTNIFLVSLFETTFELPYIYINKIEELNSIFGQQHLETLDQVINIYKNKSRDEKIEVLRKNHINKCIQWCEKNEIPHNKFNSKDKIYNLI